MKARLPGVLPIIFLLIFSDLTYSGEAVVWNAGILGEVGWGEELSIGEYSVSLKDFSIEQSAPSRLWLELKQNNETIAERAISAGEAFVINDSVRVTVEEIMDRGPEDEPTARVRIQLPASPELFIILSTERDEFAGGDWIRLKLQIENRGTVDAEGIAVSLQSIPPQIQSEYEIPGLEAGRAWDDREDTPEIDPIEIDLKAPFLPEPAVMKLIVFAVYSDPDGRTFQSRGGAVLQISGPLQVHKRAAEVQDQPRQYHIIDSIRNTGNRTLYITMKDSTGLKMRTDSTLSWNFNISPGESVTKSYRIEADDPGTGQVLPAFEAAYTWRGKGYAVFSERPVIDVYAPKIEAKRSARSTVVEPDEEVLVSIELENIGNRRAAVSWLEPEPEGGSLLSSNVNGSIRLSPNETHSIEYRLRSSSSGTRAILLPPTRILYRDVRGNEFETGTPPLRIEVEGEGHQVNATAASVSEGNFNEIRNESRDEDESRADAQTDASGRGQLVFLLLAMVALISAAINRCS